MHGRTRQTWKRYPVALLGGLLGALLATSLVILCVAGHVEGGRRAYFAVYAFLHGTIGAELPQEGIYADLGAGVVALAMFFALLGIVWFFRKMCLFD